MAGTYGWNIEKTEEFIDNAGEYVRMPMPGGTEEETTQESHPYLKRYGFCCCCAEDDEPENQPEGSGKDYYYWCANSGEIPDDAVRSGFDKDGGALYVGRAIHEGELQTAKIVPNHGCAYIAHKGEEIRKDEYEILCRGNTTVMWQECQHGQVPPKAVPAGCTVENEKLFIGRVYHDGTQTPGKIHPGHGVCYIPYGGEELCFPNYEALILDM